jgi:hypothetical protein
VTVIGPVVAPLGTVEVIWVAELTVNVAVSPLNRTDVAPVRFVPVIVTLVPIGPLAGLMEVMVGGKAVAVTEKLVALRPEPAVV